MDLGEKDKFGLEKRNGDHMNYHTSSEWQFSNQSIDSSITNPMASFSPCPPVSMVDTFCSDIYSQSTNPQNLIGKPLSMGWNTGILSPSLSHFPADSGFIERAARFSSFGGGNFVAMANNLYSASEPLSPYSSASRGLSGTQSPMNEQRDNKGSTNESGQPEFSGDGQEEAPNSSYKVTGAMKRKRSNQDIELDIGQGGSSSVEATKEIMDTKQKGEQNSSTVVAVKPSGKNAKDGPDGPKEDYIHVRARRGQATNSHSLAERVRREKISERMKFLQELVPGCSKVTGKAVMLDEIINYVQSLQRQVEFLSMKLATVNPRLDFNIEGLLSKDIFHLRDGPLPTIGFSPDMVHPQLHPSQQSWLQTGIPGMANPSDVLRRAVNVQLTTMTGYKESASQMANSWEDELHNIVQMTFGANTSMNTPEAIGKPRDGFPL